MLSEHYSASNAFTPFEAIVIDNQRLNKALSVLYKKLSCYDHKKSDYKKQLDVLIEQFTLIALNDRRDDEIEQILSAVELLKKTLSETNYVDGNAATQQAYFHSYKKNLEIIYYLIKDWNLKKKQTFVIELGARVAVCATGAHTQLANYVFELTEKPCIDSWLAGFRKNILTQFAEEWIAKYKICDGSSLHVHYFCYQCSQKFSWNIPGMQSIKGYSDERFKPASLDEKAEQAFKDYFEAHYTGQAIVDNIVLNFNAELAPYLKKPITSDVNTTLMSILDPFIQQGIFSATELYEDFEATGGVWKIKSSFQTELPKYVKQLLLRENIITSKPPEVVNTKMIPFLDAELRRINAKHGAKDCRIPTIESTIDFLKQTVQDKTIDHCQVITNHIQEIYLDKKFSKHNLLEKIGLVLLNILMALPLGIPGLIKYAATGSSFFALNGKSQDLFDDMYCDVIATSSVGA